MRLTELLSLVNCVFSHHIAQVHLMSGVSTALCPLLHVFPLSPTQSTLEPQALSNWVMKTKAEKSLNSVEVYNLTKPYYKLSKITWTLWPYEPWPRGTNWVTESNEDHGKGLSCLGDRKLQAPTDYPYVEMQIQYYLIMKLFKRS